mgnify:CR=1 FL=1
MSGWWPLLFGDRAHAIHEVERFLKIRKLEGAGEVMFINNPPVRKLVGEVVKLATFQREHVAFAGNASLAGPRSTCPMSPPRAIPLIEGDRPAMSLLEGDIFVRNRRDAPAGSALGRALVEVDWLRHASRHAALASAASVATPT